MILFPIQRFWKTPSGGILENALSDFHLYLADVLMVKMDIATMPNSLEQSPFLDQRFVRPLSFCRG